MSIVPYVLQATAVGLGYRMNHFRKEVYQNVYRCRAPRIRITYDYLVRKDHFVSVACSMNSMVNLKITKTQETDEKIIGWNSGQGE